MVDMMVAKRRFLAYVSDTYDTTDERIRLKLVHSFQVAQIAKQIAESKRLTQEDCALAELIGLLHDIGRFEQLRQYNTFLDAKSVNHAALGVQILQETNLLSRFLDVRSLDSLVLQAIRQHNQYQLDEGLDNHTYLHATMLRDADKTDIFRVHLEEKEEHVYLCSKEQLEQETITDVVYEDFMNSRPILSKKRKTHVDILLSHMALIFDFHDAYGLSYLWKEHRLEHMVDRYVFQRADTREKMKNARAHALDYMQKRISLMFPVSE